MTVLSAQSIRRRCVRTVRSVMLPAKAGVLPLVHRVLQPPAMIVPFHERTRLYGMTFGLGPAGYDVRIDRSLIMWPLRFVCADTMESFDIPIDLKPNVQDKSSWARRGITVQNTTLEPGWRGRLRLEITNHSWWFRRIRAGSPIAQIEFNLLDEPTEQPYPDDGKYQDQGRDQGAIIDDGPSARDWSRKAFASWLKYRREIFK